MRFDKFHHKPSRRDMMAGIGVAALSSTFPRRTAIARTRLFFGAPAQPPSLGLSRLAIDAGGYCLNIDVDWYSLSGLRLVSVDTVGCYRYNPATKVWTQLITNASTPWNSANLAGLCWEARFAPSLLTRYGAWFQPDQGSNTFEFIASEDSGATWRQTGLTCNAGTGGQILDNFGRRWASQRIAIDPNNPNVCYTSCQGYSSTNKGLWRTDTLGTVSGIGGWTKITDVPDPDLSWGCAGIVFDVSGGTTTRDGLTVTKNIIAPSAGRGVYLSQDGGATWSQISDPTGATGPAWINAGEVFGLVGSSGTYDGWYWCTTTTSQGAVHPSQVWKYKIGSGWTHVTLTNPPYGGSPGELPSLYAACNQLASGDVIFVGNAFYTARTMDNGGNFIHFGSSPNQVAIMTPTYMGQTTSSSNVTWLEQARTPGPGPGYGTGDELQAARDPLNTNRVLTAQGVGVLYMDWPSIDANFFDGQHYVVDSLGIQQLETDIIVSPPGSSTPIIGVRDRGIISPAPGNAMATTYFPAQGFGHCYAIDWASSDPSYCVATVSFPASVNYAVCGSASYGAPGSWAGLYGSSVGDYTFAQAIACLTPQKILFVGTDQSTNAYLRYSTDGVTFNASAGIDNTHWATSTFVQWNLLAADRVTADTYYAYVPSIGLYKSTDAGANFTLQSGPISGFTNSTYLFSLQAVPGHAGHLIISSNAGNAVMRSTDGGVNWTNITTAFDSIYVISTIGATKSGASYPRLVVSGIKTGDTIFSWYYSDDAGATWNLLFLGTALPTSFSLRSQAVDGNDATIFYLGAGHPGQGGYKFVSAV